MHSNLEFTIKWDFDTLDFSLRRGYLDSYNFYAIYLNSDSEYWNDLGFQGNSLFYVGSTRFSTTTQRLLNNHDGLQSALQHPGDILVALGKWEINDPSLSIKEMNDYVRLIESALIYEYRPLKNKVYKVAYNGPKIKITNSIRSFGGLDLISLIMDKSIDPIDKLIFSDLITPYLDRYFIVHDVLEEEIAQYYKSGIIELMSRVEIELIMLNSLLYLPNG
jgi:hypothetical protein